MTEVRPAIEQPPPGDASDKPDSPGAPGDNVVRLPAEPTAKRYPAAFWRRQVPLLAAALLSLAWLGAAYYLNWSDPVIIMMPLLLPWLVAAVYLLANPNRHARIDAASGLDHSLRPVEAAEARIMALIAKLDKRMETIAAVAEVASSRFENMAQAFERQMNDMFNAATAVEKIAAKVDVRLRDGAKGLADVKEAFIQDGGALADRLTALVDTLQKAADDAKTSIGATTQSLHGDMERLQAALAATTADGNRLAETLENLDRSVSAIAAALKHDAEEIAGVGQAAEKTLATSLRQLNDAIFEVREALAASDQQLAATRKVYEAVAQEMSMAQIANRQRQRKEGAEAAP